MNVPNVPLFESNRNMLTQSQIRPAQMDVNAVPQEQFGPQMARAEGNKLLNARLTTAGFQIMELAGKTMAAAAFERGKQETTAPPDAERAQELQRIAVDNLSEDKDEYGVSKIDPEAIAENVKTIGELDVVLASTNPYYWGAIVEAARESIYENNVDSAGIMGRGAYREWYDETFDTYQSKASVNAATAAAELGNKRFTEVINDHVANGNVVPATAALQAWLDSGAISPPEFELYAIQIRELGQINANVNDARVLIADGKYEDADDLIALLQEKQTTNRPSFQDVLENPHSYDKRAMTPAQVQEATVQIRAAMSDQRALDTEQARRTLTDVRSSVTSDIVGNTLTFDKFYNEYDPALAQLPIDQAQAYRREIHSYLINRQAEMMAAQDEAMQPIPLGDNIRLSRTDEVREWMRDPLITEQNFIDRLESRMASEWNQAPMVRRNGEPVTNEDGSQAMWQVVTQDDANDLIKEFNSLRSSSEFFGRSVDTWESRLDAAARTATGNDTVETKQIKSRVWPQFISFISDLTEQGDVPAAEAHAKAEDYLNTMIRATIQDGGILESFRYDDAVNVFTDTALISPEYRRFKRNIQAIQNQETRGIRGLTGDYDDITDMESMRSFTRAVFSDQIGKRPDQFDVYTLNNGQAVARAELFSLQLDRRELIDRGYARMLQNIDGSYYLNFGYRINDRGRVALAINNPADEDDWVLVENEPYLEEAIIQKEYQEPYDAQSGGYGTGGFQLGQNQPGYNP